MPSRKVHNDIPTFVKKHVTRRRNWQPRDAVVLATNRHQSRTAERWRCFNARRVILRQAGVMRPPNNQSLTRLTRHPYRPLPTAPTSPLQRPRRLTPTNETALTSTPFTASCETVACRLRINLVKLPARPGVVLARSWIDKLPGPVFRRHVTRSTSRPRRGRETWFGWRGAGTDARYQNASRKIKLTCARRRASLSDNADPLGAPRSCRAVLQRFGR